MPEQLFREIIRYDGCFKDRKLEDSYLEHDWLLYSLRLRIIFMITGLAYLGGIFADHLKLGADYRFYYLFTVRIITFLTAMVAILFTLPADGYKRIQKVIFAYYLTICFSECMELGCKPELGRDSIPFLLFINITYVLFFRGQFPFLVSAGVLGTLSYGFVLLILNRADPAHASTVLMTFVFVIVMSVYYTRNINRSRRMEFFAVKELRDSNTRLLSEIKTRKDAEEKLKTLSFTDELTGLFNRRHFSTLAEREISRADRTGNPLSLLFLDVDHFKAVNDNYGHDSGDAVLRELASILKSTTREIDISGRFGGEEFTVLLPDTDTHSALAIAERLRKDVSDRIISYKESSLSITVSIGVSGLEENGNLDALVNAADKALYEAKAAGRNRSILSSPAV